MKTFSTGDHHHDDRDQHDDCDQHDDQADVPADDHDNTDQDCFSPETLCEWTR